MAALPTGKAPLQGARLACPGRLTALVFQHRPSVGLELTFHRAFDLVKDQRAALNDLVACRVRRVLSSGGEHQALQLGSVAFV